MSVYSFRLLVRLGLAALSLFVLSLFAFSFEALAQDGAFDEGQAYEHSALLDTITSEDLSPNTGTLVAAALETAGYAAQGIVLRDLGFMFESFGALLYLVVIVWAIISVSLYGSYREAAWGLIGPVAFFFIFGARQVGAGANWQWGATSAATTDVVSRSIGTVRGGNGEVVNEVSWFFDEYNKLISNFIQQGIQIVLNDSVRDRSKFTTRQRVMDHLMGSEISDDRLLNLIQWSFSECGTELEAAREFAKSERYEDHSGPYRDMIRERSANELQLWEIPNHSIPNTSLRPYLEEIISGYSEEAFNDLVEIAEEGGGSLDVSRREGESLGQLGRENNDRAYPTLSVYAECLGGDLGSSDSAADSSSLLQMLNEPVSCERIWCLMGLGLHSEVLKHMDSAETEIMDTAQADVELKREIWRDLLIKLSDPQHLTERVDGSDNYFREQYQAPELSLIPVVLGGHLLRRTINEHGMTGSYSSGAQSLAEQSRYNRGSFDLNFETMNADERNTLAGRFVNDRLGTAKQAYIYTFALYIPYIQGAVLYILALTFPFFAMMLIVPGQAKGFLGWMGLWIWVKIWDLGFAFVMVIDDLLWNIMPHSSRYNPFVDPNDGPMTVLETAFDSDPTYSVSFYYSLIGTLITAVPMITAYIFLGSKQAIAGIVTDGAKSQARPYEGAASAGKTIGHTSDIERARGAHAFGHDVTTNSDGTTARPSPEVLGSYPIAASLFEQADAMRREAQFYQDYGGPLTAGGVTGLLRAGVEMQRMANKLEVEAFSALEAERYFALRNTATEQNLQALAGATRAGRNGHWFTLAGPHSLPGIADQFLADNERAVQDLRAHYVSQAALEAFLNGGAVASGAAAYQRRHGIVEGARNTAQRGARAVSEGFDRLFRGGR